MPSFAIVDSHVHFWDRSAVPISWPAGKPIDRPFRPADLDADVKATAEGPGGLEVEAIVFVEANVDPSHHLAEADFVAALGEPRVKAIVAHAPLDGPDVEADLAALAARPLVRGVRHLIQNKDAVALTTSPAFREGLARLPAHGFHFELCLLHHQFAPVLDLVAAMPDVSFVLDHMAKPGIKAGLREPWWHQMAELARHPNVTCKLSGVATEADHAAWQEAELRPYMDRTIEVFGPDRLMFGSDWPVMRLATSYGAWVGIVERALAGLPEADQRKIFNETARRIYRL